MKIKDNSDIKEMKDSVNDSGPVYRQTIVPGAWWGNALIYPQSMSP